MRNFVLVSEKNWHNKMFDNLACHIEGQWIRIKDKADFTYNIVQKIRPEWIFIPHWSYIIPSEIYENFKCVVFHMTDLPYGRGGSPLQNLIAKGHITTMISAMRVSFGIDTGPIYLKKSLTLEGSAIEIFKRSASIIQDMIVEIIKKNLIPVEQSGQVVIFKRRKLEDGNIE